MRIAYITADRGIPVFGAKGASIHIREMVNAFSGLNHDVTVFAARRGPDDSPLHAEFMEVSLESKLPNENNSWLEGEEKTREKERYSIAMSAAILQRLQKIHAKTPFDLIYERYALFSTTGVRAAQKLGIPCAVEVNTPLILEQQKYRKLIHLKEAEAVESEVFCGASVLFTVSEQVQTYVESKGASPSNTFVLPNGVDITRFHPKVFPNAVNLRSGQCVIGFVGSLKPWHGIDVLLDAFRTLQRDSNQYHLLIVGDGPLRPWVEGYLAGAGLDQHATITGWIPNEQLPGFIQSMDIAVSPYPEIKDFYFSPLKLYEYMAVGKPIVASKLGQIAQVINDGVNGILTQPGDSKALVTAIKNLYQNVSLRQRLGQAAANSASQNTWNNVATKVIARTGPGTH